MLLVVPAWHLRCDGALHLMPFSDLHCVSCAAGEWHSLVLIRASLLTRSALYSCVLRACCFERECTQKRMQRSSGALGISQGCTAGAGRLQLRPMALSLHKCASAHLLTLQRHRGLMAPTLCAGGTLPSNAS